MQTRNLGTSDLSLTPIGVGAWAMGGADWAFSWGPQEDGMSIAAIHAALDHGVNWIDTAAVYGLGHSEEVVGKAIHGLSRKPLVFTKCERTWDENGKISPSLRAASVRRECEASLRRLNVDVIDLYQIHWPEPDEEIEEGWTTMQRLKDEGKVRWIGVSNFNASQMARAAAIAEITSLQPPYSMLARGIEEEMLPYCERNKIGVIGYSPMASGLLTGAMTRERIANFTPDDWRRCNRNFQEPKLTYNLQLVESLLAIGDRHGRTPGEVAIAWALRNPAVTAAIVGVRSPQQVEGIIGAASFRLGAEEISEIESATTREDAAAS